MKIYKNVAHIYDLIYSFKDYREEVQFLKKIILEHKNSQGNELLDVACGTGKHLKWFKNDFNCTGMDSSKEMLKVARKNVDALTFLQGNMIKFDLKKTYDIITCLFSSIGYVKTYKNLRKTLSNFFNHLKEGGVLIIEPWFTESVYRAGSPHLITYEDDYTKIARVNVSEKKGNLSILKMHYLIGVEDEEVVHFKNKHELGLFEKEQTLQVMREIGFNVDYLKEGLMEERGLYIATK